MDSGFFAQCIYSRSIIFEMLHLGERLKLQMPRGFQHTPFSLLFILVKVHPHPYTPMAVVIDNHLPREQLISSYVPD